MKQKKTIEELGDTDKWKAMYVKVNPQQKDASTPYLLAVMIALVIGIAGVVSIVTLRPDFDILVVAGVIFAFLTPTTTSILALLKTQETNEQTKQTHLSVNSRLDAFIAQASASARAEGLQEGRAIADERTDKLAAELEVKK